MKNKEFKTLRLNVKGMDVGVKVETRKTVDTIPDDVIPGDKVVSNKVVSDKVQGLSAKVNNNQINKFSNTQKTMVSYFAKPERMAEKKLKVEAKVEAKPDKTKDSLINSFIEIDPLNKDQFNQVKETLTRIGLVSRKVRRHASYVMPNCAFAA